MRVRVLLLAVSVALLAFAPAPLPRKERTHDDPTDVAGTWEIIILNVDGKPYEFGKTDTTIEMKRDQFTFLSRQDGSRTSYAMRLDPSASPPSFTWSVGQRVMFVGSYRLQKDQMTLIFRFGTKLDQRPTDFTGVCEYHYVLRRTRR